MIAAATAVFQRRGLEGTQMSDVARRLGVTAGNLYNYVDGKDSLFLWCLRAAAHDVDFAGMGVPLDAPEREVVLKEAKTLLDQLGNLGALDAALLTTPRRRAPIIPEVQAIVAEIYDVNVRHSDLLLLIERSARGVPTLFDAFYSDFRAGVLVRLEHYLQRRGDSGHLHSHTSPAVTARLIVETTSWFARHRLGDPDGRLLDADDARTTVIAFCSRGLLP